MNYIPNNPAKPDKVLTGIIVLALIIIFTSIVAAALLNLSGCASDDGDDSSDSINGTLSLYLADGPIDNADAVYITVSQIKIHQQGQSDDDDESGNGEQDSKSWIELNFTPQEMNLLDLQNNASVLLAEQVLPSGDYNQIRLYIDCSEENAPSIVIEGTEYPLTIPSGCESGVKLQGQWSLNAGSNLGLVLDFDVRKSVIQTGTNEYKMNPVIHVYQVDEVGSIRGSILPAGVRVVVYAFETGTYDDAQADPFENAVQSTISQADGAFILGNLPAGTYDLVVTADGYETYVSSQPIEVTAGTEKSVDSIELTSLS